MKPAEEKAAEQAGNMDRREDREAVQARRQRKRCHSKQGSGV